MALTEGSHNKAWFTMFLNYVTQLYFCAARRPVLLFFFFLFHAATARRGKHTHVEVFFQWRRVKRGNERLCRKPAPNHWKLDRKTAGVVPEGNGGLGRADFTGYRGFCMMFSSYILRQQEEASLKRDCIMHRLSKSYSDRRFIEVRRVQCVQLQSSTSHVGHVEEAGFILIVISCVQSVPCQADP